ncbi:tetratricopeptide repeat protein [Myxococcus llanfairpwllgwyngyllgogerychwyrndrobwllllantysiliogogogochensis]|uniref:Tetratricopeptide repeat protein n=1 Tax=Myxococcus llanfairpwllgwyngyllgogerychwyrndrobwllllantysiliogogogochensis TaxID=2590453 RepID=A0A540WU30_9BACT|nr:tetratricopeptide repeat protein [Myxococcus llanfairpwllgwyngyllgogerychwyrndrobwllllantysiliogogogochensis]TQF11954.1 tetratricopeptide repeat protein [Myxococcus llanfairpwllgwyngyllgogerychwyrndrobwllllantysiliogogogochensis]
MVFVSRSVIALTAVLLLGAAEPSEPARAAFARGESALSGGRLDEAAIAYREALAATPGYAPALNGLGSVLFRQGQLKDAMARFIEATDADPQHKMAFFNLGYAARKAGDASTAARAYARYVQLEPDDADGYYGLAESHRQLGDKAQAIAAYQGYIALERRPSEQIWVQKARGHLKALGGVPLPATAERTGPRVAAAPPHSSVVPASEAVPPVGSAEPASGVREKGSTPSATPVAGSASPEGSSAQKGTAAQAGTVALAGSPGPAVGLAQAESASPTGNAAQDPLPFPSTRAATEGSQERPSNPALAASRIRDGDALMKERRYREAAFAFLDASHADSSHVEALFKLGNALAVLGYYGQAVEKWETATRLTQDAAIRQSAQDNITRARAKLAQAGASPQAAGQAPGSGPVADTTRAQARRAYEQGVQRIGARDFATALTHLTQAIQLEPMLAVAYTARGSANIGLRRYAEAAADYQFALELEPQVASPLYGLAESYRALGRNAEARGLYERYAASSAADVRPQLQEESRQKATKLR